MPPSFDGNCQFAGSVQFSPPMTTQPQPVAQSADAPGAWMPVTPSQDADPLAAVQACSGDGLQSFALDARMQTMGAIGG